MSEVEGSLKDLMEAFEEHLKEIRSSIMSMNSPQEKGNLQKKEREIVDYYFAKTSELFNLYDNLNSLLKQIFKDDCSQVNTTNQEKDSNLNHININLNSTLKIADNFNHSTAVYDDSGSGSIIHSDVITIFMQKLQEVASEAGLPTNYVETKLKRVDEKRKNLLRNSWKLKH